MLAALAPLGFTKRTFRAFLASLCVPYLEVGTHRFIDALSLSIGLRAIMRVGRKPFITSTAPARRKHGSRALSSSFETQLDPAYVERNLNSLLLEVIGAAELKTHTKIDPAIKKACLLAARRMAMSSVDHLNRSDQHASARLRARLIEKYSVFADQLEPPTPRKKRD